jgi:phosphopantothenoylcysteine decarboxylase/phosphopantothenate--cysteine ligase
MPLRGRKIIVTGGPTREWMDPVRFISNPSTGKMGIAIADEARERSNDVVFIHGPIDKNLLSNKEYSTIAIETTEDLLHAVLGELAPGCVLLMAAAPVDYTPLERSPVKMKKDMGRIVLKLRRTPDILGNVASVRFGDPILKDIFVVGFAAETSNIEEYAMKKLNEKRLDMICLNDVSRKDAGFGADTNIITIFTRRGEKIELSLLSKREAAGEILNRVEMEIQRE